MKIRFRSWDKEEKKMIYESLEAEWLQSTGLFDKNGKEIYEGDIVTDGKGKGEVIWNESIASFSIKEGEHEFFSFNKGDIGRSLQLTDTEIIGNIYENPELLK